MWAGTSERTRRTGSLRFLQVSCARRSFVRTVVALANQKPVSALCDTGSRLSLEGMYMSRWTRGSLVAAFSTAGLTAVLTLGSGSALADPEPAPPPPNPVELDAAPPPAPPAPPPPADLLAPPTPADPLAAPPPPGGPLAPPAAVPAAGPAVGQNPQPFVGEAPFPPPSFSPVNGSMVGVA